MRDNNLTSKIHSITDSNPLPVITGIGYNIKRLPNHIQIISSIINNTPLRMLTCAISLLVVLGFLLIAYILKNNQILTFFKIKTPKANTREFVLNTLERLGYSPTIVKHGYIQFTYKNVPMYIEAVEDKKTIRIIHSLHHKVSHFKSSELFHCMIHFLNTHSLVKIIPYEADKAGYSYIYICGDILFIKEIPDVESFLNNTLDLFIDAHEELHKMLQDEELSSFQINWTKGQVKGTC